MQQVRRPTAIIEREDDGFVSLCPELDVASQGATIEEARANLVEALTLFFESADETEVNQRLHSDSWVDFECSPAPMSVPSSKHMAF